MPTIRELIQHSLFCSMKYSLFHIQHSLFLYSIPFFRYSLLFLVFPFRYSISFSFDTVVPFFLIQCSRFSYPCSIQHSLFGSTQHPLFFDTESPFHYSLFYTAISFWLDTVFLFRNSIPLSLDTAFPFRYSIPFSSIQYSLISRHSIPFP